MDNSLITAQMLRTLPPAEVYRTFQIIGGFDINKLIEIHVSLTRAVDTFKAQYNKQRGETYGK